MDPFTLAQLGADHLKAEMGVPGFDVAVVLGTGLSDAVEVLGSPRSTIDLSTVPGFVSQSAPGHRGEVWRYELSGRQVLVFRGRSHIYEGCTPNEVVHSVRTAVLAGSSCVVLTNAAGAVDESLFPGDLALISDHINLTGLSPLTGWANTADGRGPFVDLTDLWSPRLRQLARDLMPDLHEGVYAQLPGPHFETPAEISMLRVLGAGLVGMSTALEAIATRHLGAEILGLSVVTNMAAGTSSTRHEEGDTKRDEQSAGVVVNEIQAVSVRAAPKVGKLIVDLVTDPRFC